MIAPAVLFVEDDTALRVATTQALELAGLAVRAFARADAVLEVLRSDFDGVIVSDIRMPRMDGFAFLSRVRALDPELPMILITGHGDVPMAVSALRDGAFDFLTKPFAADHLVATIRRALERRALVVENRRLRAAADASETQSALIGTSPAMLRLRRAVRQLADADVDVLVEGETGTGKDLVALMLHRQGRRSARPFVAVDCGALPEALAEAELFGHAPDSVPHSRLGRTGRIVASGGGTLLLDGIDALRPDAQARLLRVLEEREVQPIGADRADPVNLRVVATSGGDLERAVAEGAFRADLFHRLAQTRLQLPPLRDRAGDIALLFAHFVEEARAALRQPPRPVGTAARHRLLAHDWPGNVRELRNFAYATVLDEGEAEDTDGGAGLRERVGRFEASVIADTLAATGGHVARAITLLGVPRKTLYEKMARYGIDPEEFR